MVTRMCCAVFVVKQKTAYELRISDWSSDVCSSDLDAASALRAGGIIACPTEAVWGLSCDPFNEATVQRLLAIKQRPVDNGLILIAASVTTPDGLADWDALPRHSRHEVLATRPHHNRRASSGARCCPDV